MQVLLFYLIMMAVERGGYPAAMDLRFGAFIRTLRENFR
jgi:hypothetical protein